METSGTTELWPWFAVAGLGVFHGINPAMGWLFAVALGLHRRNQRILLLSLVPIAFGHALSVTAILAAFLLLGLVVDHAAIARLSAFVLIGWALWLALYGHRPPLRVGLKTGLLGLGLWSFLVSSGHGAGLMLLPAVLPMCGSAAGSPWSTGSTAPLVLGAIAVHGLAMLAVTATIAIAVYNWIDLAVLRRTWINLDRLWLGGLLLSGGILLLVT